MTTPRLPTVHRHVFYCLVVVSGLLGFLLHISSPFPQPIRDVDRRAVERPVRHVAVSEPLRTERFREARRPSTGLVSTKGAEGPIHPVGRHPALRFSTYLGGSAMDLSTAIAVDGEGYVYVAGQTLSDDFPTQNPVHVYQGGPLVGADVFVAKLSPDGDSLVYATYLGGRMGEEMVAAIAVDDQGRVIVAGTTTSTDFPTRNALQGFRPGGQLFTDAFVARLSADGAQIEVATYLGGSGDESATALALGPDGHVYVTGTTTSTNFPVTAGAVQPDRSGNPDQQPMDAFVARLRPQGGGFELDYATYLGGGRDEIPSALVVGADRHTWLAGVTTSFDFPLQGALQSEYAGPIRELEGDVFVTRLNENGGALNFSTYLGGRQDDQATGLALDADGRVVMTGSTMSGDFPTTPGAFQTQRQALRERFVVRLAPRSDGWMLDEATRLGARGGYETGRAGLAVDRADRVWLAGATASEQFPTRNAEQSGYGGGDSDAFLARLDASGAALGYATFLGGAEADVITGVALGDEVVCVTGGTGSSDFPTHAALRVSFDGPPAAGQTLTSPFVSCLEVVNEASTLTRLTVAPDSATLAPGTTHPFAAEGFDQFDQPLAVMPEWSATGGTIDATGLYTAGDTPGTFTVTATTASGSLTDTAMVQISQPIPVELAAFEGAVDNGSVLLTWTTASETNNTGFEVQARGKEEPGEWTTRAFVEGAGTTSEPQSYHYRLTDLPGGVHLFRLKQIDVNGAFEFSPVVEVDLGVPEQFALHAAYPNPSGGATTIPFDVARATHVRLEVYDVWGRRVAVVVNEDRPPGRHEAQWNAGFLSPGMYFYQIEMDDFRAVKKIVLVR